MKNYSKEKILDKLRDVRDPEIGIDIVALGLIRDVKIDDEKIRRFANQFG